MVICGISVMAVIDSGAEITVINDDFYSKIPNDSRPPLLKSDQQLVVADKQLSLHGMGVAHVCMRVSQVEFKWHVHVAPITDNLLLGYDVLDALDMQVSPRWGLWVKDRCLACKVTRKPCGKTSFGSHGFAGGDSDPCSSWAGHLGWDLTWVLGAGTLCHFGTCTQTGGRHFGGPSPCGYQRSYPSPTSEPDGCSSDNPTRLCLGRVVTRLSRPSAYDVRIRQHPKRDSGCRQSSVVKPGSRRGPCWRRQVPDLRARASSRTVSQNLSPCELPSVRQWLAGLLVRRQRAFARNRTDLGSFNKIKHEINANGAAPVREWVRRTPRGFEGEEEKCFQEQLEAGVIQPSSSAWAAPTVLLGVAPAVKWPRGAKLRPHSVGMGPKPQEQHKLLCHLGSLVMTPLS